MGAFLLEPGAYYLSVTSSPKGVIAPEPEFSFVVPPNKPLVYIGSLHVACTSTENAGWSGGWTLGYRACSPDATAANEDEAAKLVAQASFKEFGPPLSAIMHHYPSTTLAPGTLSQVAPIGLLMPSATIDIGSPEWMRRALQIGLSPSALLGALGASGGGLGGGVLVGFAVLWAPVGTVLGYVGGKFSESSWEPCRLALQESITKFDPMTALATQLKAALDHEGVQSLMIGTVANAGDEISVSEIKSVLNSRMTRVGLRLCSPTLCLDVATHVTLFDVATQTYVYDKVLAYSGAESELPYELRVTKPGYITALPGRDLEAYCGEGGGEKLQGDLSEALDATVAQIVHDFGLKLQ